MQNLKFVGIAFGVAFGVAGLLAACSSDSDDSAQRGSGVTGHADAIVLTEEEVLNSLTKLFTEEAGMDEDLASCYSDFFEREGLAESIQDLVDLGSVQEQFTEEQAAEYAACGPAFDVESQPDEDPQVTETTVGSGTPEVSAGG